VGAAGRHCDVLGLEIIAGDPFGNLAAMTDWDLRGEFWPFFRKPSYESACHQKTFLSFATWR
jgi:hypothetical protein